MPKGRMSPFSGKKVTSKGRIDPWTQATKNLAGGIKAGLNKPPKIVPGSGSGRVKPKLGGRGGFSTQ